MRMSIHKDLSAGPMIHQCFQDLVYISPFVGACVEFSIAISSCTSLTKTIIAFRIYQMILIDSGKVSSPGPYIFSSFNNDGFYTQFQTSECGKQSGRTSTNNMAGSF